MKRWEEQQRKKLYASRIQGAKPTLATQPKRTRTAAANSIRQHTTTEGDTLEDLEIIQTPIASESSHKSRLEQPIFQLLKAFKLQQYAAKLAEVGYGQNIYKLALLNEGQRQELVGSLKVLPGHRAKLMSLFDVIDELYPRRRVAEQLRQFATPGSSAYGSAKSSGKQRRAATAGQGFRQQTANRPFGRGAATAQSGPRSLIHQYDALDPQTKQAFNSTFLINLESVRYPQLVQQHFLREESDRREAINQIFPPAFFYAASSSVPDQEPPKQQYVGRASLGGSSSQPGRRDSSSQNRQDNERHLKQEMAHALKVIEKVNREFEQMTSSSQQEYESIRSSQQQKKRHSTVSKDSSQSKRKPNNMGATAPIKPQSGQAKRSNPPSSSNTSATTIRQAPPPPKQQVQPKPVLNQTQPLPEVGRFQSNRALARQKQLMHPRVITEHEIASEMTTPQSKAPSQERPPFLNVSGLATTSGFKLQSAGKSEPEVQEMPPSEGSSAKMEVEEEVKEEIPFEKSPDVKEESPKAELNPFIVAVEAVPPRQLSPLLEREERDLLWNNALGHSLDTKQVTSALGYLDLKQICLCLAHALNRHIQFSQGFYFLDDLQEQIKALHLEQHLKLDFSYEIDPKLKVGLPMPNPKKEEKSKREFEDLKQQMLEKSGRVFEYAEKPKSPGEDTFERDDDEEAQQIEYGLEEEPKMGAVKHEDEEEQYIHDYYGNSGAGTLQKLPPLQLDEDVSPCEGVPEEEPLDLDYSHSHLEDFLRSQRGTSMANTSGVPVGKSIPTSTTQQLMNTFLTSYNKNKRAPAEVIREAKGTDESGSHESPLFALQPIKLGEDTPLHDSLRIDVRTKEGLKDLLRFQMRIFDSNYDFDEDVVVDGAVPDENPSLEELYYYCKYVIISGRMEKEIPILCLVYIERFLTKTGILLNHLNWRRLTLISLCLASKIWDDDSLENVHFPKVMPDITVKEIASLEKLFLQFLDFDLLLRGAEYAKYYFVLKTFAAEGPFNSCLPPVGPLAAAKMSELQNNTAKVESELRDKYEVRLSLQKTM